MVEIADVTREVAGLALAGPDQLRAAQGSGPFRQSRRSNPSASPVFEIAGAQGQHLPAPVFTGDLGYELWIEPADALTVWDALMAAGRLRGLRVIGYEALEMARIEAGFLLPKVDFLSAQTVLRTDRASTPYELGLGLAGGAGQAAFQRPPRAARPLQRTPTAQAGGNRDRAATSPRTMRWSTTRRPAKVGMVTSALWSPTCKRNIAYAWLDAPYGQSVTGDLWVEIYLQKEIRWQRRMARCQLVDKPFFVHPRRSATPPGDF